MRADEIIDRKSLEAWLNARPEDSREADALAIAQRAALRVLALFLAQLNADDDRALVLMASPILRALLASGVLRKFPETDVRHYAFGASVWALAVARGTPTTTSVSAAIAAAYAAVEAPTTADAAADAAASAHAAIWQTVRDDARVLDAGRDPLTLPLWPGDIPPDLIAAEIEGLERLAEEMGDPNSFWHRWYLAMKRGEPMDWALQREVALIPDAIWQAGPKKVLREIVRIEASNRPPAPQVEVLGLAHTDFSYDVLRKIMRMVPFDQDISRLRDAEVLRRLKEDAADLRSLLDTLQRAAEASGRQTAIGLKVYAEDVRRELDLVDTHRELRVGVLIDLGEALQDFAGTEDVRLGLGPALPRSLDRVSDRLLALLRNFFVPAMVRTAPLREIALQVGESPSAILTATRQSMELLRRNDGNNLPPLAPEDIEALDRLKEELQRTRRQYEAANDPEIKAELGNTFARKAYQLSVDAALYIRRALDQVNAALGGKDNDTADAMFRRLQLYNTATEIGQWLLELLRQVL